jgi:hypothetical protein
MDKEDMSLMGERLAKTAQDIRHRFTFHMTVMQLPILILEKWGLSV